MSATTVNTDTGELLALPVTDSHQLTPQGSLALMREAAAAFREIANTVQLYAVVQGGSKHLTIEGYQAIGLLVGITATVIHTERDGDAWKATAEARRLSDGMVVGQADALCSRQERRWAKADDYAICSMASTRAQSRALRGVVAPIAKLADPSLQTTAAEEMPDLLPTTSTGQARGGAVPKPAPVGASKTITAKQVGLVKARQANAQVDDLILLGLLYEVTGNTSPAVKTAADAAPILERALPRFPAAKLDELLQQLGGDQ